MEFRSIEPMKRDDINSALTSSNPTARSRALLAAALHDDDWQWVQARCLAGLNDPDLEVVCSAATGLGHLARIHGTLDVERVTPALDCLMNRPETAGIAEDVLEDIWMFVRPQ